MRSGKGMSLWGLTEWPRAGISSSVFMLFYDEEQQGHPVQYICLIQRVDVLSLPPKPSTAAIISADYELLLCLNFNKGALIH